ncbi:MAG: hypothetical protein EU531_05715 [Promethearchaeota archaeon]|nr:MAG: hypothetical protein EU531_05715 [Candidatus Lokiarchaeota archaeon]
MKISFEEWWYEKIFKEYSKPRKKKREFVWLCKILKKLNFLLEFTKDLDLVNNSLLILVNLLDDGPLDNYEKLGKDIRYLPSKEREKIKKLLNKTLILEKIENY